jgi:hypothetical protein
MYKKIYLGLGLFFSGFLFSNPFAIQYPVKEKITNEDYIEIQKKLQEIDVSSLVDTWYPNSPPRKWFRPWSYSLAAKQDFFCRISKAKSQTLIDPTRGFFPKKELVKIGKGGDNCFVCYASFNGIYPKLIEGLAKNLEDVGFNGYLFYRIGGFPNPTGKEINYCGIPYVFKIFSLIEAHQQGFNKVLWIDAAFLPLKDPTPLFTWLEKEGAFIKSHDSFSKFILPKTVDYLKELTAVDVLKTPYVSAQIIGFDFRSFKTKLFIHQYYQMADLGLPFLSCFPEEYVFTAITGKDPELWHPQPFQKLSFPEVKLRGKEIDWVKKEGYFFLQRNH